MGLVAGARSGALYLCATMTVVRPLPSALMAPWMALSVHESRAEVASSSSRIFREPYLNDVYISEEGVSHMQM